MLQHTRISKFGILKRCVRHRGSFPHLGSSEVAGELPLFQRVSHRCPLTDRVVSVGQAHVNGGHRSILWKELPQHFQISAIIYLDWSLSMQVSQPPQIKAQFGQIWSSNLNRKSLHPKNYTVLAEQRIYVLQNRKMKYRLTKNECLILCNACSTSSLHNSAGFYYPSDGIKLSPDDRQPWPFNYETSKVTTPLALTRRHSSLQSENVLFVFMQHASVSHANVLQSGTI